MPWIYLIIASVPVATAILANLVFLVSMGARGFAARRGAGRCPHLPLAAHLVAALLPPSSRLANRAGLGIPPPVLARVPLCTYGACRPPAGATPLTAEPNGFSNGLQGTGRLFLVAVFAMTVVAAIAALIFSAVLKSLWAIAWGTIAVVTLATFFITKHRSERLQVPLAAVLLSMQQLRGIFTANVVMAAIQSAWFFSWVRAANALRGVWSCRSCCLLPPLPFLLPSATPSIPAASCCFFFCLLCHVVPECLHSHPKPSPVLSPLASLLQCWVYIRVGSRLGSVADGFMFLTLIFMHQARRTPAMEGSRRSPCCPCCPCRCRLPLLAPPAAPKVIRTPVHRSLTSCTMRWGLAPLAPGTSGSTGGTRRRETRLGSRSRWSMHTRGARRGRGGTGRPTGHLLFEAVLQKGAAGTAPMDLAPRFRVPCP